MDSSTVKSYLAFHEALKNAATPASNMKLEYLPSIEIYTYQFIRWWRSLGNAFAEEFHQSENFQALNNRIQFMENGSMTLISFAAALYEAFWYSKQLIEEFRLSQSE